MQTLASPKAVPLSQIFKTDCLTVTVNGRFLLQWPSAATAMKGSAPSYPIARIKHLDGTASTSITYSLLC